MEIKRTKKQQAARRKRWAEVKRAAKGGAPFMLFTKLRDFEHMYGPLENFTLRRLTFGGGK